MATKKNNISPKGFKESKPEFQFAFTKENYMWMIIGVVLIILGYVLLVGGGSNNPDEFNMALFNARRLVFAPIFIVGGLVVEVFAIMKKPSKKQTEAEQ
jgi:hypothetical protein